MNVNVPDSGGRSPLFTASECGNLEITKILLDLGADVTASDKDGLMPLHMASYNGHFNVVSFLLGSGADITATDKDSRTPLLGACPNDTPRPCGSFGGRSRCHRCGLRRVDTTFFWLRPTEVPRS